MTTKELMKRLKKCPQDFKVEFYVGTDHWEIDEVWVGKPPQSPWWNRKRKVVILR